ncbi:hypothetical protein BDW62DRAFT_153889 [Aspergillus aurantiobrunneus]
MMEFKGILYYIFPFVCPDRLCLWPYFLFCMFPIADPILPTFISLFLYKATLHGSYTSTCINPNEEHSSIIYFSLIVSTK